MKINKRHSFVAASIGRNKKLAPIEDSLVGGIVQICNFKLLKGSCLVSFLVRKAKENLI